MLFSVSYRSSFLLQMFHCFFLWGVGDLSPQWFGWVALKLLPIYEIFDLKYGIVAYSFLIALPLLLICFSYLKTHKDPFHCNRCIWDTLGLTQALCNWSANVRNSAILDYAHPLDYSIHRRRRTCRTALRQLAERCEFESITPNQILREKLEFRIRDSKGSERLLRKNNLSLINHNCKTSCGQIRDGLFTNWKMGFDSDPQLHDLKLLVLELFLSVFYFFTKNWNHRPF